MDKKILLIVASSLMLFSCGNASSSTSADTGKQTETSSSTGGQEQSTSISSESVSYDDPFADWTPEDRSDDYSYEAYSIQIGGDIKSIPDRFWNPEAAYEKQCFAATEDDHNLYELTIDLDEGDTVLFFFDFSWLSVLDFDDIDWNVNPDIKDVDSYVSDRFEGEDVSSKFTEIHILKKARFTFTFDAFGVVLGGMKSGMALASVE